MRISLAISSDDYRYVAPGARLWQDLGQNKGGQAPPSREETNAKSRRKPSRLAGGHRAGAGAVLAASFEGVKAMTPQPPLTSARDLANSALINVRAGFLKPEEQLKSYDTLFTNEFVK